VRLANLHHETIDSVVIAEISGEIDMSNTNELRMALSSMTSNDALGLVVDLSELEYIDSAGIQLVYRLRDSLRSRGQQFRLVIPRDSVVYRTLKLAAVQPGSEMVETLEAAREAFVR
jgi:anti-sigma B factor antagonist